MSLTILKIVVLVQLENKRILLVDDDPDFLNLSKIFFESKGFAVDIAANGTEAIQRFKESPQDLLIVDIKLPDMLGDEVVKQVRDENGETSIIMITGYPHLQESIDLLGFNISDILLKPVTSKELLLAVYDALDMKIVD